MDLEDTSRLTRPISKEGSFWRVVMTVVLSVLCVTSLIIASVALSKVSASQLQIKLVTPSSGESSNKKKIWSVAVGHDYGAHEYFDHAGNLQGLSADIVRGVCRAGGMDCQLVLDQYTNCWKSSHGDHPSGGVGLLDSWYDGCIGWFKTVDRDHVFNFSEPYTKMPEVFFFMKPDSNFTGEDLADKKIGFIEGWATDEKCLAKQEIVKNRILPHDNIVYAKTISKLEELITTGQVLQVDAGFTSWYSLGDEVEKGNLIYEKTHRFNCFISGNSLMTRKDSEFVEHWNRAFNKFYQSGDYKKMCEESVKTHEHQGSIQCLD